MRVLLAAGGTAGHINPALAIASIIKENVKDAQFLFAGTPFGMEAKLIPQAGFDFAPIKVKGFQRQLNMRNIKNNIKAVGYLTTSGHRAKQIINDFKPDIAIGTGGYVSGPVILKAAKMGIPTVIHEQNAFPGVTTRLLSKHAKCVMLTVEAAAKYLEQGVNYTVTGLPVRSSILSKKREDARKELGFDNSLCILSFGGSLGSECINENVAQLIEWHTKNNLDINHIHAYGSNGHNDFPRFMRERNIDTTYKRLKISEYINNMDTCMACADLVICRSGAATLAELEARGRAAVLIPAPHLAGNHQYYNAKVLSDAGAAVLIEQKDLTPELLIDTVKGFYENPAKLTEMSKKSNSLSISDTQSRILEIILQNAKKQ